MSSTPPPRSPLPRRARGRTSQQLCRASPGARGRRRCLSQPPGPSRGCHANNVKGVFERSGALGPNRLRKAHV
eukprot:10351612-Lingulodinium_polyedra.AAC.1